MTSSELPVTTSEVIPGPASLRARLLVAALYLTRKKKIFSDIDALYESIDRSQQPSQTALPKWLTRRHRVQRRQVRGHPVYTLRPHAPISARHVLYLHGGAYVHQIQRDHWKFLSRLITSTGCSITVPLYPLAPGHQVEETTEMVRATHDLVFDGVEADDQVFMGDSAGGALALVLARELGAESRRGPKEVVLISPWLDVTVTDPAQPALDRNDPYLGIAGLREAGTRYAGERDRLDPLVSPLAAPAATPGRLSVFVGTRDILLADARRFRAQCEAAGVPVDYHEYEGMFHAWVLARTPESAHADRELAKVLRRPPA